jgi:hypothetical protein
MVCDLYQKASELQAQGVHLVSTDEKTGLQTLERKHPTWPMAPGLIERREFEYIRHGPLALIANFEVASGQVLSPSLGPTRTEEDFAAPIGNACGVLARPDPSVPLRVYPGAHVLAQPNRNLVQHSGAPAAETG